MSAVVREQAISPKTSFLVQAPAGSGKTALLSQRILALLAELEEPEELMALTFTRKAAAEMRARVLESLYMPKPDNEQSHSMVTWRLAEKVLQRCHQRQWRLLENPNRLRIMTLDSLTAMLTRQLPLLSGLGAMPQLSDHAQAMYQQAAENTLKQGMQQYQQAVEVLLSHQDNSTTGVITLIANMLQNREQWLKYTQQYSDHIQGLRDLLEHNLACYLQHQLQACDAVMPVAHKTSLARLCRFAGEHGGSEALADIKSWPSASVEDVPVWQHIANLLLTASSPNFRKRLTKAEGFPAAEKDEKTAMLTIISDLENIPAFAQRWHDIRTMPNSATFHDEQWKLLAALFTLLPLAVEQLQYIFMAQGSADFTEISLRTLQALYDEQGKPSDMLMQLDYRIQHILIDEFQDTSELQIELLRCLTAGWQYADNIPTKRTLFMVGDPMQSIYRFRKAEVSLFLDAANNQVNLPSVQALSLQRNFRSSPVVVDWVNRAFARIFPDSADAISGAVCHAMAEAARDHDGGIHLHLLHGDDIQLEAEAVVKLVQEANLQGRRVGILARTRKHLHAIMPALEAASIAFRAVKILPLAKQPEVRTLRALSRALLHPADRASWAALLRAPCCGLNNIEMFHVLRAKASLSVWHNLHDSKILSALNDDARLRIEHVKQALQPCVAVAGRIPVRQCIESAWLRLGMPQLLGHRARTNVETVFQLLESLESEHIAGQILFRHLDERLEFLYAAADSSPAAAMVELMTIHGSKGLQWDTVILPGMGKSGGKADAPFIAFTQAPMQGKGLFLLSPKAQTRSKDALFSFIQGIEKSKAEHEQNRQLYVACTRAECHLHIFGHVSESKGAASKGSFLHTLLEHDAACFDANINLLEKRGDEHDIQADKVSLQRMRQIPKPLSESLPDSLAKQLFIPKSSIVLGRTGGVAAAVGNTLHAMFQQIGDVGIAQWDSQANTKKVRRLLMMEGLSGELLRTSIKQCQTALDCIFDSTRARWILSNQHKNAHCEWAIIDKSGEDIAHYVIDRSFEDAQGTRWIIDYKTASCNDDDLALFLDQQCQHHQQQLQNYAHALQAMGYENIRLALYFPMLDAWREWAK